MSKNYYVCVTETYWVWVDAENEDEALRNACEKAWAEGPDEIETDILEVEEDEDDDE